MIHLGPGELIELVRLVTKWELHACGCFQGNILFNDNKKIQFEKKKKNVKQYYTEKNCLKSKYI